MHWHMSTQAKAILGIAHIPTQVQMYIRLQRDSAPTSTSTEEYHAHTFAITLSVLFNE